MEIIDVCENALSNEVLETSSIKGYQVEIPKRVTKRFAIIATIKTTHPAKSIFIIIKLLYNRYWIKLHIETVYKKGYK